MAARRSSQVSDRGVRERSTRQFAAVQEELARSEDFRSAQDIHAALRLSGATVGLATVYRALQSLVDSGEADVLRTASGESAYRDCEPWRQELLATLRGHRDFLRDFLARELPGITIDAPIEATYLAWLNVSALQLSDPAAHFEKHGVGLSDGAYFGAPAGKYVRLNFGCTRATLLEALQRMKKAVAAR